MTSPSVAWISDFPIEWVPGIPSEIAKLPKQHPTTWQSVLLPELKNRNFRIHILVLRKGINASLSFEREGVVFHVLKVLGGIRGPSFFWADTLIVRKKVKEINPDLVHAWGSERGAGLIASRISFPYLFTVAGPFNWYKTMVPLNGHQKISALAEILTFRRANLVTVESKAAINWIEGNYPELTLRQVEHAPNWMFFRTVRNPQASPVRFLSVGTLGHVKGTDLLLRAFEQIVRTRPAELVVVSNSDPEFLQTMRNQISSEAWNRITFKANLPPEGVVDELSKATIFLFPTRADNSPNAVKEAAVAGVPVVASKMGAIPDYLLQGRNGLLFETGDLEQFVGAIRAACDHPNFGVGKVELEALEQVREYLSPSRMADSFSALYGEIIKQRKSGSPR